MSTPNISILSPTGGGNSPVLLPPPQSQCSPVGSPAGASPSVSDIGSAVATRPLLTLVPMSSHNGRRAVCAASVATPCSNGDPKTHVGGRNHPARCTRPPGSTLAAVLPLRIYPDQKGGEEEMGRLTPMTTRISNLAMDLVIQTKERLAADGEICEQDEQVILGLKRLSAKSERLGIHRRAARTLEDACEVTPHVVRLLDEDQRDLAPILALSPSYPRDAESRTDTA